MSPIEWFFAHDDEQSGPVSSTELKRLAAAAKLLPDDLVWREGLAEWTPARNVRGLFDEEAKAAAGAEASLKPAATSEQHAVKAAAASAPARHLFDVLFDSLRTDSGVVDSLSNLGRACGLYGLLLAMMASAVFGAIVATKSHTLDNLLPNVGFLLLLAALQYTATKSCDALDRINRAPGASLASSTLPDCLAALSLIAGLMALLSSISIAIELSAYLTILPGVAAMLVWFFVVIVALNPAAVNVSIGVDHVRPGETALASLWFLLKVLARLAPVGLGVGVISGTVMMGVAAYETLSGTDGMIASRAAVARSTLIQSAALPLAVYLMLLLGSLALDLCRAILVLPKRLSTTNAGSEGEKMDD